MDFLLLEGQEKNKNQLEEEKDAGNSTLKADLEIKIQIKSLN